MLRHGTRSAISSFVLLLLTMQSQAQEQFFANLGGVDLYSVALSTGSPDYAAVRVEARTVDPNASITGLTNISFAGAVQQIWTDDGLETPSIFGPAESTQVYREEWNAFDSYLLLEPAIGGGVYEFSESNDGSRDLSDLGLPDAPDGFGPLAGFGTISMREFDGLFLKPEFQSNTIAIAYLARPRRGGTLEDPICPEPSCFVDMTLGVLGAGITNAGEPGGAAFGYNGNLSVNVPFPLVPEPESAALVWTSCVIGFGLRRCVVSS